MTLRSVVLGGGPVGLLASHLLGATAVVSESEVGGPGIRDLAPFYLWRTPATEALLRDLDLPTDPLDVPFGWLTDDGLRRVPRDYDLAVYAARSRGNPGRRAASDGLPGVVRTFRTPLATVLDALTARSRVVRGRALRLAGTGDGTSFLSLAGETSAILAERVINTLPAPAFDRLLGFGRERAEARWSAGTKVFAEGDPLPEVAVAREAGLAYVYVTRVDLPFDRATIPARGPVVYEFNDCAPLPRFLRAVRGRVVLEARVQVRGTPRPEFDEGVRHVGRMARWDHSIRLHDVVDALAGVRS